MTFQEKPVLIWGLNKKEQSPKLDKYNRYMLEMFCPSDLSINNKKKRKKKKIADCFRSSSYANIQ